MSAYTFVKNYLSESLPSMCIWVTDGDEACSWGFNNPELKSREVESVSSSRNAFSGELLITIHVR